MQSAFSTPWMLPLAAEAPVGTSWAAMTHDDPPGPHLGSGLAAWSIGLLNSPSPVGVITGECSPADLDLAVQEMARLASARVFHHVSVLDLETTISVRHAIVGLARKLAVLGHIFDDQEFPLQTMLSRGEFAAEMPRSVGSFKPNLSRRPIIEVLDAVVGAGQRLDRVDPWLVILRNPAAVPRAEGNILESVFRIMTHVTFVLDRPLPGGVRSRDSVEVRVDDLLRAAGRRGQDRAETDAEVTRAQAHNRQLSSMVKNQEEQIATLRWEHAALEAEKRRAESDLEACRRELALLQGRMVI